ncbi:hypothetical protein BJX63DRAFT_436934 [Aspergillus granulosus]|uniref:DRBM domain-containing protein n=1 Tax=Aspergillus granulosus TaxID=176169 RepID=A0ABR4GWP1_9EURO
MPSPNALDETRSYDSVVGTTLLLKYVTLVHAEEVDEYIPESNFRAEVSQMFEDFNYQRVLQRLNNGYFAAIEPENPRKDFLRALGFFYRTSSEDAYKFDLNELIIPEIQGLHACASSPRSESTSSESDGSSPPPYSSVRAQSETVEPQQPAIDPPQRPNSSNIDIWRYTSRLWEEGHLSNEVPSVTDTLLSSLPIRFRVTVAFRGRQGHGEAPNKKEAKHIASRAICQQLGIVL